MQFKVILLFIGLAFMACQSNPPIDIVGSWTTMNVQDNTGMNITDKVDFNNDGSYVLTMYSNGDSVVSKFNGSYEIIKDKQILIVITNGTSFNHKIIAHGNDNLKIKTSQGIEMTMKRIK